MTGALLVVAGAIYVILGLVHAAFTQAGALAPNNPAVMDAMAGSSVKLARGRTTMWDAWLGFNFSHSLGAAVFGLLCVLIGSFAPSDLPRAALFALVLVSAIYLWLALRYWFRIPVAAIGIATLCLLTAWLAY